jgi:hypothetical protein
VPQKAGSTFPNLIGRRRISGCKWNFDRYCRITFLIFSCFLARLPPWSRIIRCIFGCFSIIASIHTSTHFCNTCNTITNQDVDKVNLYTLSQPRYDAYRVYTHNTCLNQPPIGKTDCLDRSLLLLKDPTTLHS